MYLHSVKMQPIVDSKPLVSKEELKSHDYRKELNWLVKLKLAAGVPVAFFGQPVVHVNWKWEMVFPQSRRLTSALTASRILRSQLLKIIVNLSF